MIEGPISARDFFEQLNKDTMHLVHDFYDPDVLFCDPMVKIKNRTKLKGYYRNMYKNVEFITWKFSDEIRSGDTCVLVWEMTLKAKNFNSGQPLSLDGTSVIKFGGKEGKAVYHRDYFDMGAFVYEGIPLLGGIIRFIKKKMHNEERG